MSKLICPICKTEFAKSIFNVKIPNSGVLKCKEFEGMPPKTICQNCVSGLMRKDYVYFDAFLNGIEDFDFHERLISYVYSGNNRINKLDEERKKYSIPENPIASYNYFNIQMTLYPASQITGKFMIAISHLGVTLYYILNAASTVFVESKNDTKVDGSQVEKALLIGLAGGSFLGYIAASAAKVYDVVEDFSLTVYDTKNEKKVKLMFAPKSQKMTSDVYEDFSEKATLFIKALLDIIG
ncbi:MAG: hypothetical protein MJ102_00090 [Clostridia bacterium]|nr:hypothetical protein [Clostridia bacterium]